MIYLSHYKGPRWALQHKIAVGPKALVFRLSDDYAVKFKTEGWPLRKISDDNSVPYNLSSEFQVLRELYNRGVSVPKPFGVFRVDVQTLYPLHISTFFKQRSFPGLVMEYIPGVFIENAPKEKRGELKARAFSEMSKAINLGLSYVQEGYNPNKNVLWVPESDKIYLTGFDFLLSRVFH